MFLTLACLALHHPVLTVELAERRRQAIEFRSGSSPGSLDPAAGTLTTEYGPHELTEGQALAMLDLPAGKRFVPGAGFPPTFDTDLALTFGKTKLEPGSYLVCVERLEGAWQLVFVGLASALAAGWTGGEEVPGAGTVVAARAAERRTGGGYAEHRLWTAPSDDGRGLVFQMQYGRLALAAELQAKAKRGKPAAWEEKRWRSSLRADGALLACLEHGQLVWGAESEAALGKPKRGKRYGLGQDYWTGLTVLAPLALGGKSVPAGEYALTFEAGKGDEAWALALIDSAVRRKAFTNLHHADELAAAVRVPLAHEEPAIAADELDARFVEEPARLAFHFGPHRWSALVARP